MGDPTPIDVPTAGLMAAIAPKTILDLTAERVDNAKRVQQRAAFIAASPVFWFRVLPVRESLWATERVHEAVPSLVELDRVALIAWERDWWKRMGRRAKSGDRWAAEQLELAKKAPRPPLEVREARLVSIRRVVGRLPSTRPLSVDDLADDARAVLCAIGEGTGLRLKTLLHVTDWAYRAWERAEPIADPPPLDGESDEPPAWRNDGQRRKRQPLSSIRAMQERWAWKAGLTSGYYARLDSDVQQPAEAKRADRAERVIPAVLRPDVASAMHTCALLAMLCRLEIGPLLPDPAEKSA